MVGRPGVSKHVLFGIERVPTHCREDSVLPELTNVDLDPLPRRGAGPAICIDHRCEVIAHRLAIRQVDRDTFSNRQEGPRASSVTPSTSRSEYRRMYSSMYAPTSAVIGRTLAVAAGAVNRDEIASAEALLSPMARKWRKHAGDARVFRNVA